MEIVYSIGDIHKAAEKVWAVCRQYKVWAFKAPMGAGKTTFIHALCDILQVTNPVSSPTFAIINEYYSPVAGAIYHMDWYRLKSEDEAAQAGVEECLYSNGLCLVEWPEKANRLLPYDTWYLTIELVDEQTRKIVMQGNISPEGC